MTTLTRTEIRWILNLVVSSRENNKTLIDVPGQQYAPLHELKYENMDSLADKLERVLETNAKRIEVARYGN